MTSTDHDQLEQPQPEEKPVAAKSDEVPAPAPRKISAVEEGGGPEEIVDESELLDEFEEDFDDEGQGALTPRQARRIRIWLAAVLMVAAAVALVLRLSAEPSLLVMGIYGAALVLCGVVIELSRRGRTRLGMWLLVGGLIAVAAADQMMRSAI